MREYINFCVKDKLYKNKVYKELCKPGNSDFDETLIICREDKFRNF